MRIGNYLGDGGFGISKAQVSLNQTLKGEMRLGFGEGKIVEAELEDFLNKLIVREAVFFGGKC